MAQGAAGSGVQDTLDHNTANVPASEYCHLYLTLQRPFASAMALLLWLICGDMSQAALLDARCRRNPYTIRIGSAKTQGQVDAMMMARTRDMVADLPSRPRV